ncbi:MAG: alpha/beta hydrolase [Butyrivibrio sp.]|nr:alpha/beta hydrolase [Butyrivibrio sp.]
MAVVSYDISGKTCTLYTADSENIPLIVLSNYADDGGPVWAEVKKLCDVDFNLLSVGGLNWGKDMTPWECPPLYKQEEPYSGGADEYTKLLISEILPRAKELIKGVPEHTGIAGYSLGGLYALYNLYTCAAFDCAASVSGSLWFPEFKQYAMEHDFAQKPCKLYLSLGDAEDRSRNQMLRTVRENTQALADHYKNMDIDVTWELNEGNHFKDATLRTAKGIAALLSAAR